VSVQSSTDLLAWSETASVLTLEGINTVTVSAAPEAPSCFWRLKRPLP